MLRHLKHVKKIPTLILNEDNLKTVFPPLLQALLHIPPPPISYASLNFIVRHAV